MRRGLIFAVASGLMPAIFASQAYAIKITADGVTVFSENFENYAVGPLPVGAVPAPGIGSWSAYNPGGPGGNLNVANSSTGAQDPAGVAAEGTNYMSLARYGFNETISIANADFDPSVTIAAGTSLHAEFMANIYPSNSSGFSGGFGTANTPFITFYNDGPENTATVWGDSGFGDGQVQTGLTFEPNTWQEWTLDWVVSAPTATIGVAGQTFTWNLSSTVGLQIPTTFVFYAGPMAVDAIPGANPAVPGDFDADGDVDGADFVVWQTHFPTATGATLADGDADNDGDVDGADFVVWQTNFPTTPGSGVSTVPEPHSVILIVLGGSAIGLLRRSPTFKLRSRC